MLPYSGQGSNQAIEDAGALGFLLKGIESAPEISRRLEMFEVARRKRASRVQVLSRVRVGKEQEVQPELSTYAHPPGSGTFSPVVARQPINADGGHSSSRFFCRA